jgi:uncharacterized membrane protein
MEIFTQEGFSFLSRWAHFLGGITWIGLLYYFNFVQVPAFPQMGAPARNEVLANIAWRALFLFRWGAVVTVVSGLLILGFNEQYDSDYFQSTSGTSIFSGAVLGIIMLANVWLVIWPAQQTVIGSARRVMAGGEADPAAAAAGRRGLLASRQNTIFSIPLLFFMGFTGHLAGSSHFEFDIGGGALAAYWIVFIVLVGALELNALGRIRGYAPNQLSWPYETIRGAVVTGFVLIAILYVLFEILFQR